MNTVLDIYVEDRNQRPIPGAKVTFYVNGQVKGGAETSGEPNRPVKLQATQNYQVVEVRVEYLTHRIDPVKVNPLQTRQFTFHLDDVELPAPEPGPPQVPDWFPIAGVVFAAVTMLFFMGLVVALLRGVPLPNDAGTKFTLTALLAICAGFTFTFLGAKAVAKGVLPIPFLKDKPIAFSAAGGVAVFIIVYVLANIYYPSPERITWRVSPQGPIDLGNVRVGAQKAVDFAVDTNSQTRV
jgi:hypothetical protein